MTINSENQTYNEYFNLGLPYTVNAEFNGYGTPLTEIENRKKDKPTNRTEFNTPVYHEKEDMERSEVFSDIKGDEYSTEKEETVVYSAPNVIIADDEHEVSSDPEELPVALPVTELVHGDELVEVQAMDLKTSVTTDDVVIPENTEVVESAVQEVEEKLVVKKPRGRRPTTGKNLNKTKLNK